MKAANDFLATHGATKAWQDDCGQNYSKFTDNDTTYKVWLEDSASAECRLKRLKKRSLPVHPSGNSDLKRVISGIPLPGISTDLPAYI